MPNSEQTNLSREHFIAALSSSQNSLFRFIYSLLPDPDLVDDVLQETNMVLWRKVDEYDETRDFLPWARKVAHFQVLAAIRDRSRSRLVLDEELVNLLEEEVEEEDTRESMRMHALERCLSRLPEKRRELLLQRYRRGASVEKMANTLNQSVGALSQALYRIRQALMKCVERQLSGNQ